MDEDDSCRICRSGPEPDALLYHPCKCTGSIRYCHQDCLVEWLQHSRKKYCELCNHAFIFHKKYRKDMPSDGRLPRYLYFRRLVFRSYHLAQLAASHAARALLVGFTWLALLPYININVWRFLFWSADVATWMGVPGATPPFSLESPPPSNQTASNLTHSQNSSAASQTPLVRLSASLGRARNPSAIHAYNSSRHPITVDQINAALHSLLNKLANDCFQGQIISCIIVVFFVGVFLLREWILQNIPQHFDPHPVHEAAAQPQPVDPPAAPRAPHDLQQQPAEPRDYVEEPRMATLGDVHGEEGSDTTPRPHELDLDPDAQREQARQARIRRLESQYNNSYLHQLADPTPSVEASASHPQPDENHYGSFDESAAVPSSIPQWNEHPNVSEQMARDPSISSHGQPSDAALAERPTSSGKAVESVSAPDTDQPDHAQSHSPASSALDASQDSLQHQARCNDDAATSEQVGPLADTSEPTPDTTDPAAGQPADPTINRDEGGHEEFWQRDAAAWEAFDRAAFRLTAYEPVEEVDDELEDESEVESEHESEAAVPAAPDDAALRAAAVAAFPPPIAHPPLDDEIEVGVAADADDPEAEIGLAEEMDGILEAIGMRGPLFGIVQNLFLMIFLCAFVMLAFVILPYIVGRALGSGPGLVCLLAAPVKLLRYVTDPLFDSLIAIGANSIWPKLAGAVGMARSQSNVTVVVLDAAAKPASQSAASWISRFAPSALGFAATPQNVSVTAVAKESAAAAMLVRLLPHSVTSSTQWAAVSACFDVALAAGVRGTLDKLSELVSAFFVGLDAHRAGTSGTDRAFCVAFGHGYWMLALFVHQHFSKPDLHRAAAEQSALKMFMDQHVLIIKAIVFIFIELAVFPLGCGLLLDICTMPLLDDASIAAWPRKLRAAPLTFAFTRWMGGTIYMFIFAQYVSATRRVLRPGVLCWIRDPNDPSFHPIREILDKRSLTQLRKIGASALMYAAILVASVGVNTYFLRYAVGWTGLLPLRWTPFEALTEVPVDLLLVHFALPWATHKIDPDAVSQRWMTAWWRRAASMLRLSSYLMGGEFKYEQRTTSGNAVVAAAHRWLRPGLAIPGDAEWKADGGLCRVPADDKAITTGPLIIPLDADGNAPNERLAEAIAKQDADAEKHTPRPTYAHIYLPSHYRARITAVLVLLWLSHCAAFMLGLGVPLMLGRALFALRRREVHDVYAYVLGLSLLWTAWSLVGGASKMWTRRKRRARMHRTSPGMYLAVHMLVKAKRVLKAAALLVGVAGVMPLVMGMVIDQYLVAPLRDRGQAAVRLGQVWACGVIEARLALFAMRLLGVPEHGMVSWFMAKVDHVLRGGLYPRARVRVAWTYIVAPITSAGVLLLATPTWGARALIEAGWVHAPTVADEYALQRRLFGVIQTAALLAVLVSLVRRRMDDWTDVLKDEVFLESTVLKNYTDTPPSADSATAGDPQGGQDDYAAEGTLPDVLFR